MEIRKRCDPIDFCIRKSKASKYILKGYDVTNNSKKINKSDLNRRYVANNINQQRKKQICGYYEK
jgi:hypothetical protein